MVIFFWTPPHYWPLSLRYKEDYANAHVPMLPVVERFVVVARQIVAYSWAMVLTSLALIPVQSMGWVYTVAAVVRVRSSSPRATACSPVPGPDSRRTPCGRCASSTSRSPT